MRPDSFAGRWSMTAYSFTKAHAFVKVPCVEAGTTISAILGMAAGLIALLATPHAQAQMGPMPGLTVQSLGQPNGPAKLGADGSATSFLVLGRTLGARSTDRLNLLDYMTPGTTQPVNTAVETQTGVYMALGSTTLYTSTALFAATTAMVGNTIVIPGAGVAGASLATTIAAYVSPTQVTLAAAASTALTGAGQTILFGPDASAALAAVVTAANARMALGNFACVYIPTGGYLISSPPPAFTTGLPGCIIGEGPQKSIINLTPTFAGDLFAWSEAWVGAFHTGGPHVSNLRINGWLGAPAQQNALMFYDRNDYVSLINVDVWNMPGRALASGLVKVTPANAYMRESHLQGLRFFSDGAPGVPVVEFNTNSGGPGGADDSTNEISVSQLDIFGANGPSLVIRDVYGYVRDLKFDQLRIESTYDPGALLSAGDLVQIGDPASNGIVTNISFTNSELIDCYTGYAAFRTTAASAALMPYNIYYQGAIGGGRCNGQGIRIDAGRQMKFSMNGMSTVGPNVVVGMVAGSTTTAEPLVGNMVGGNIVLDGDGYETSWTYAVNPVNAPGLVAALLRSGTPNLTGAANGAVTVHGTLTTDALTSNGALVGTGLALTGSVAQAQVFAAPAAASGVPGFRALGVADVPGVAALVSPALTGTPTVPTAAAGTSTTQAASTAFVGTALTTYVSASSLNQPLGPLALDASSNASAGGAMSAGMSLANHVVLTGGATGIAVSLGAVGSDTNIALNLAGKGSSGALNGTFVRTAVPGTADIPSSTCADWHNSSDGTTKRYCNTGGTVAWTPGAGGTTQQASVVLTYSAAGTYTPSVPSWATALTVDEVAGGSSGANGGTAAAGTATSGGAGGSGSQHRHYGPVPVTLVGSTVTVVVGAGGAAPSGAGGAGNVGTATTVSSGNLAFPPAYAAGASSGGSPAASSSGGAGGPYGNGGNASGATAGTTAYGTNGSSGGAGLYGTVPGVSASGGGGAVGGPGGSGGSSIDGVNGAGSGGGVNAAGTGQSGGGITANAGFGNNGGGVVPGGNAAVTYTAVVPGMNPAGGAGGAGGNATTAGGNGALGSGAGAPGGGGGSTITGQTFGLGAKGNDGQVVLVFSP
jgi:hypothetical protein